MKHILFVCLILLLSLSQSSGAQQCTRTFLGEIDGYISITTDNDSLGSDADKQVSEFSLFRDYPFKDFVLRPFYLFRNESYGGYIPTSTVTENTLGVDFVVQATEMAFVSFGMGYINRMATGGTNKGLISTKFRLDF